MLNDIKKNGALLVAAVALLAGCSSSDQNPTAFVNGTFTVSDSIDSSGDYSGISVTVINRDSAEAAADTLFHQLTDTSGYFSGMAQFPDRRLYTLIIGRNQTPLIQTSVILAEGDTVRIDGELPNLQSTLAIQSNEHEALRRFQNVDRSYNRVVPYIQAGALTGDSLRNELRKWGDLFWDLYEQDSTTLAGQFAATQSTQIYGQFDEQVMMQKLREIREMDELAPYAARYGAQYLAQTRGLDYSLRYLDTLQSMTATSDNVMSIRQERIELLYDSARIDQAQALLETFKEDFSNNSAAMDWIEVIEYDLNYLSPGDSIPPFSFDYNSATVSRDSLIGAPYILEITLLSNQLYQEQYDRTYVIQNVYKDFGLEVITIPLDESQVTIDAFFDERTQAWPVASADAFDRQQLIDTFNIRLVPTRFLVDREGNILRKYIGQEYQNIIQEIQTLINTQQPSS